MKPNKLPLEFLNSMKQLLSEEYEDYLNSFDSERLHGLRINNSKITKEEWQKINPFQLEDISWVSNGYYYNEIDKPSKDVYYHAGLYYLQEPSAMTPASLLPVTPGDRILDVCAAPGGKSTELGVRLKGKGVLYANDLSNSRAKALLKNLELFGIPNICVTSETPEKLSEVFPAYFDGILVDAPCSGEGMFRKNSDMVEAWMEHPPTYYAEIQSQIMQAAITMLKPGGHLLYSTCTFSRLEDEEIILEVLRNHADMELVKLPLVEGFMDGIGLSGCIRMFPHRIQGEGHFIALLQKKKMDLQVEEKKVAETKKTVHLPKELLEFLAQIKRNVGDEFVETRIQIKNNMVYYLPEGFLMQAKLRYLRTGLLMGELKKNRFEPSQALAMTLTIEEFANRCLLKRSDERVLRYLKGETLSREEWEDPILGWCLVCVDSFPLGFAKGMGMTLKNKYYPGWRWQ